jgi:internalin A
MKRILKGIVPLLLIIGILLSIGWYIFVYDREFTRDMLISQARYFDSRGNSDYAAKLYDLAYDYTGKDEDVAIELASQYRYAGNYTKAEYTLTNAIADGGSVDLYIALCKTFVEQDKLQDAVAMLDNIADPVVKRQIDALRPAAPAAAPEPGFYNEYVFVNFPRESGTLYVTTNQEFPSLSQSPFTEPVELPGGETILYALNVADNGLVSPLTIVSYTISGVIEEASFADPAVELALRTQLGLEEDDVLMTDMLWEVKEFTLPADTQVLTDLSLLPYLEKLTIRDHKLESLSFLSSLSYLKELDLGGSRFPASDLTYVAGLGKLEWLSLSGCGLSTISDLSGSTTIRYLDLSSNTLRNLEPLIPMTTLEELYLQHNAVTALDSLTTLSSLVRLDISYNSVRNIAPLSACPSLTWLNAGYNSIADVKGVETFPSLTHLNLGHNLLTDVDVLAQCPSLTELDISHNSLINILALSKLVNLTKLVCSHNKLEELPTFPEESVLNVLDASYNSIISIYPLRHLQELTYVYLDYNEISNIDIIADCYRLVMVNAYGNPIEDVSQLTEHNIIVNYDPTN